MSASALEERVAALERRLTEIEVVLRGPASRSTGPGAKPVTVREFLNASTARSSVDKALVVSIWLERNGHGSVTSDLLSTTFGQGKEPIPSNPSDLLYQNGRRGFMSPGKERTAGVQGWFVTASGERYFAEKLERV